MASYLDSMHVTLRIPGRMIRDTVAALRAVTKEGGLYSILPYILIGFQTRPSWALSTLAHAQLGHSIQSLPEQLLANLVYRLRLDPETGLITRK